ncbi:MAG: recombination mediator RecR [Planctomycetota bacterium]
MTDAELIRNSALGIRHFIPTPMPSHPKSLQSLVEEFNKLPGIGERTAERLAYHVLVTPADEAMKLAYAIRDVKRQVRNCSRCFNVTENDPCDICRDETRDRGTLCIVENPRDVLAIEKTGVFRGLYHVLLGRIAPLDGTGPKDLTLDPLLARLGEGGFREVVLATNPDMEGDATAYYLLERLKASGVRVTRIARGVPAGSTLESVGKGILTDALRERHEIRS